MMKPMAGCEIDYTNPINRGLVGLWLFNEGGGKRVNDYSGYGNHGTLTNFAMTGANSNWVGSDSGGALSFDGTDDYVNINNNSNNTGANSRFNFTQNFSVFAIITPKVITGGTYYTIVDNGISGQGWFLWIDNAGKLYGGEYSGGYTTLVSTTVLTANKTYSVAVVRDNANITLYINGIYENSAASSGTITYTRVPAIGGSQSSSGGSTYSNPFNGVIDFVGLYSIAISQQTIKTLTSQPNIGIQSPTYNKYI